MSELEIQWQDPTGAFLRFALDRAPVTIGRREDCELLLPHGFVSSQHARLRRGSGGWTVEDLGSTNGTTLNGGRVDGPRPFGPGDAIGIGSLTLRIATSESDRTLHLPLLDSAATEFEKLSYLLDLRARWEEDLGFEAALIGILDVALRVSGAERACILVAGPGGDRFAVGRDARGSTLDETQLRPSRSVVERCRREGAAVFMTEGLDGELAVQASIVAMHLRAVACLPLGRAEGAGGLLYLDSTRPMHMLSGLDQKILRQSALEAADVFERAQLLRERQERLELERELRLARQTQAALLPRQLPRVDGWTWSAHCEPTREVGGDFYDFVELEGGRTAIVLADVSGKGVAAALVSASVQGALQLLLRDEVEPERALLRINDYLCARSEEGRFVTLVLLIVGPGAEARYLNAGHNPAFLRRRDGTIEELERTGLLLGSLESDRFGLRVDRHELRFEEGDVLLLYSDGLSEAQDPAGALFGEERVRQCLLGPAEGLHARLLDELDRFCRGGDPGDDVTWVVVSRTGGFLPRSGPDPA